MRKKILEGNHICRAKVPKRDLDYSNKLGSQRSIEDLEEHEYEPRFADRVTEAQGGDIVKVFTIELKHMALTFGPQLFLFVLFPEATAMWSSLLIAGIKQESI